MEEDRHTVNMEKEIRKWRENTYKRRSSYWFANRDKIAEIARDLFTEALPDIELPYKQFIKKAEKIFVEICDEKKTKAQNKMQSLLDNVDLDLARKNYDEAVKIEDDAWASKLLCNM